MRLGGDRDGLERHRMRGGRCPAIRLGGVPHFSVLVDLNLDHVPRRRDNVVKIFLLASTIPAVRFGWFLKDFKLKQI